MQEEIKKLKKENIQLKKQLKCLFDLLYITDEALDVVLNKMNLEVHNKTITDLYELKTTNQTSNTTVRYYVKNEYLLSAPEELKEELTLEFNRLMNIRPKLSIEEVKTELRFYKEMLLAEVPTSEGAVKEGVVYDG